MKLKGIELKGTYKVKFDDKWFEVYNENDNVIYIEYSSGYWEKIEYDKRGNHIYFENSIGHKIKIKGE